ncbi:MAG: urea ABC transporter ATP-binding protein UrtD [Burkholderiaceae bacterium]|nr:urea ABC transporter ATP-binding protein UrtD [Burkholderiaceae bacterium]
MAANALLDVRNLTVKFGGFTALSDVSLRIEPGEVRVIIGPNGAGKTTLLDVLCGKTRATSGSIEFEGVDLARVSEYQITRLGIGRKFQTPSVYEDLTVYQNLEISVLEGQSLRSSIFGDRAEFDERIIAVSRVTEIESLLNQRAGILSHGQKQWLEIGMLLVQHPKLILLDEPVAGMSLKERDRTVELIQRIAERQAIVVIEHDMDFVRKLARKVTVLHQGAVLCEGNVETVQSDARVQEVYLGH